MGALAARKYLTGATFHEDEDSEDELNFDSYDWSWIYQDDALTEKSDNAGTPSRKRKVLESTSALTTKKKIIGARKGSFQCFVGDIVLVHAGRNESWTALIYDFVQGEGDDDMLAQFMWFSHPKEIRNSEKKRTDVLPNEIYVNAVFDENPLDTIEGRAYVISLDTFESRYPTGKVPKTAKEHGKVFICRRGCNTRTATYTTEFRWEDVYRDAGDIESLRDKVLRETKATRKRKGEALARERDLEGFVVDDEQDEDGFGPRTPSKRRKLAPGATPRSKSKALTPRKFTTPTHRRFVTKKPLEFTPLGTRVLSPSHVSASPFQVARSQLHVAAVPAALPCREEEFSTVYTYLESAITDGTGSCIYISGTPGTGKTATVREVVAQLHASVHAEELDDFIFVEINGMKVTDPHQSYSLLWEALTGERLSATHALGLLEREFSTPSPRRVPCVVLMDELDQLVTKNQSVMYNFFNWPNLRHSRLIVLAVANTMDLPERTLSNKISSRLGLTRIAFPGYTHEQLIKIIESRLSGVPDHLVDPDAVQFASRKVAQVSGDARRALDICRRAVEIAETEAQAASSSTGAEAAEPNTPSKRRKERETLSQKPKETTQSQARVTIPMIQKAIREATTSPLQQHLRSLPLASKVFLAALLARVRRTGVAEVLLGDVIEEARKIGAMSEVTALSEHLLHQEAGAGAGKSTSVVRKNTRVFGMGAALAQLAQAGVVMVENRKGERAAKCRACIGEDEVKLALKDDVEAKGMGFAM